MYLNCQLMKSRYSIRRLRRFLFCAAAPHLGLAALAFKTWGCFNKNLFCHILHFLSFCYDKICPIFVTSYTFCHFVMTKFVPFLSHQQKIVTNFLYNYSFLCIKLYIYAYFDILSHFCHIFCHMGQILSHFQHLRNPVIPRVFAFG